LQSRYTGEYHYRPRPDMSTALERSFQVLEKLAAAAEGRSLSSLSQELDMPLSATHRVLADLCRMGYVRQSQEQGVYALTIKLVSLGLGFLSSSGVVDVAQPLLDELAKTSGELVRLAVTDGDELVFVAKAQGATRGLRYDPDMGLSVQLSCSAAGHAWLSTMSDDEAMALVSKQGLGKPEDFGPKAPTTLKGVLAHVRAARKRGFSTIVEVFAPGMTAMGAAVRRRDGRTIGVVTIAGPLVRLTEQRMLELGPALVATAAEVGDASHASGLFRRRAA
jgi:IclR family acetate operon transcriptional repressor